MVRAIDGSEAWMVRQKPLPPTPETDKSTKRRTTNVAIKKWMGRPLAAQRDLASRLMATLAGDFERHGAETLVKFRLETPRIIFDSSFPCYRRTSTTKTCSTR
jgi:hypothetical protein